MVKQDCQNTAIVAFPVFLVLKTDSVFSFVFSIIMWAISISIRPEGCIQFQKLSVLSPTSKLSQVSGCE